MPSAFGHESQYFKGSSYRKEYLQHAHSISLWLGLNPSLTITEHPLVDCSPYVCSNEDLARSAADLRENGYFQTNPVIPPTQCEPLANAVIKLIDNGIHPLFSLVYDQFWQVLQNLSSVVNYLARDEFCIWADFWVWAISQEHAHSGWGPHRDNQVDVPFFKDGRPTVMNLWIPLTDTDPTNGCIYVLPKSLDPHLPDHPEIRKVENVQDIRALPARKGSVLGWDQHLLHWGGRSSKQAVQPRISFACYYQSKNYKAPTDLMIENTAKLTLDQRLYYIARAFLRYDKRFGFPEEIKKAVERFILTYEMSQFRSLTDFKKTFGLE